MKDSLVWNLRRALVKSAARIPDAAITIVCGVDFCLTASDNVFPGLSLRLSSLNCSIKAGRFSRLRGLSQDVVSTIASAASVST
jgi:hypothetical protein